MIDIVELLRARNEYIAQKAADEIESLRQRVKELEFKAEKEIADAAQEAA